MFNFSPSGFSSILISLHAPDNCCHFTWMIFADFDRKYFRNYFVFALGAHIFHLPIRLTVFILGALMLTLLK